MKDDKYNISVPDMILHRIKLYRMILDFLCDQKLPMYKYATELISTIIHTEPMVFAMNQFQKDLDRIQTFMEIYDVYGN